MEPAKSNDDASGEWEFSIYAHRTVDNRHHREYGRPVAITVNPPAPASQHCVHQAIVKALAAADITAVLRTERGDKVTVAPRYQRVEGPWPYNHERPNALTFHFFLPAERPTKIVSEPEARAWAETVFPYLRKALQAGVDVRAEEARRERVREHATTIARWLGERARKAAQSAVRYEQRLAALEAELAAEVRVQLAQLTEEGSAKHEEAARAIEGYAQEAKKQPVDPEAIAFGWQHASRYAGSRDMFGGIADLVMKDLYPDEEKGD